jgi:hypothetical protein
LAWVFKMKNLRSVNIRPAPDERKFKRFCSPRIRPSKKSKKWTDRACSRNLAKRGYFSTCCMSMYCKHKKPNKVHNCMIIEESFIHVENEEAPYIIGRWRG